MKRRGSLAALAVFALGATGIVSERVRAANNANATTARIELGRRLFYDADLSQDGTMACATCHEQRHGFADGNRTHPGVTNEAGRRNVPGLANVGEFSPLTSADPRLTTLEAQVSVPVLGTHPVEMGMAGREAEIARRLGRDACYRRMFAAAFPGTADPIGYANVVRAIAAFERTLASHGSAYDHDALSADARAGQETFRRDCAACHAGKNFTDLAFHRLGAIDPAAADQGLFEVTAHEEDRGKFRTPPLRNLSVTAPYWHDGSMPTARDAIARHGFVYPPETMRRLEVLLDALTDHDFLSNPAFALPATACGRQL
ncbi:cytochrome-c peroxidase [Rudaea sp.]|uniref:cytochrome-c peroxidase n=1 Tax=Rudaea sp. TaxID=2136325 RepID=UPI002ECFF5DE